MSDLVLSVEEIQVNTDTTSVAYNLTKGQDYANCVPFFSVHGGQDYQDAKCIDAYFSGTTQSGVINFRRYNSRSTQVYIKCHVVEFDPLEVKVQQWTGTATSSTTQYNPPEAIVQNRTGVMFYWRSSSTSQNYDRHTVRWRVNSGNTVDTYKNDNNGTVNGHFFSFEALNDQFTVEHSSATMTGTSSDIVLSKCYDPLKTFIIGTQAATVGNPYTDRGVARIFMYGSGTVRADRSNSSDTVYWSVQVIEFQDNKIHTPYWYFRTMDATTKVSSWDSEGKGNIGVDLDYSMVTLTSNYFGRVNSYDTAVIDNSSVSVEFESNKSVTFYKNSHSSTTYVIFQVVDWIGTEVDIGTNGSPIDPNTSMVKSVDNFRILIADRNCFSSLTKGQVIENCVVFASQYCSSGSSYQRQYLHDVFISDTGMVCASRLDGAGEGRVDVSVVEYYPDQVRVQSGRKTLTGTSEINVTLPITIDIGKSFLLAKWANMDGSRFWARHNIRCRIKDNNTVGFYRNAASLSISLSWFVVEDLGSNWEVTHSTPGGMTGDYNYRTNSNYYDRDGTFVIASLAGGNTSYGYSDRSCARAYYSRPSWPIVLDVTNATDTKYYSAQVIRFIRDSKCYVVHWNPSLSSGTTATTTYTSYFSDSSALTSFNTTLASYGRYSAYTESSLGEVFTTFRITDYGDRTLSVTRDGSSTNITYSSCILINWVGADMSEGDSTSYVDLTKSLVMSVESIIHSGAIGSEKFYLTKGQKVENCLPIATWRVSSSSYYQTQCMLTLDFMSSKGLGSPNFLQLWRGGTPSSSEIQIYILEFDPQQVKIQHGIHYVSGTIATISIEEVNLEKAFLYFYCYDDSWSQDWDNALTCGRFVDSDTIEFHRHSDGGYNNISWFVVECLQDQWAVQHLYTTPGSSSSNLYSTLSHRVNLGKTMLFGSFSGGSDTYYGSWSCFRFYPRVDELIQYNKGVATGVTRRINTEVVEFGKDIDIRVITDFTSLTGTTETNTYNLRAEPAFDLSRSIVYNGQHESMNRVDTYEGPDMDNVFHKLSFDDGNTVRAYRYQNDSNSYGFFFAVEFPEYKTHYIEGSILEQSLPVVREVHTYRSDNGKLMDSGTSISGTGYFRLETTYSGAHYVVCVDDDGGFDYNNLIYGKIYPEEIVRSFV